MDTTSYCGITSIDTVKSIKHSIMNTTPEICVCVYGIESIDTLESINTS